MEGAGRAEALSMLVARYLSPLGGQAVTTRVDRVKRPA